MSLKARSSQVQYRDAIDRLLQAWRGELESETVYKALAVRQSDEHRAQIIYQMAEAENKHRQRLEDRLRELGVPIPDPKSIRLSVWARLQLRVAPLGRILAAREAAEEIEVSERYKRPTGDAVTDALLRQIRVEEREHALRVAMLRQNDAKGLSAPVSSPEVHLARIIGRESWHRAGGGWVSGAIYGANDGLAAVFGIVSGVSGATGGSSFVLTAGLAGAIASALSMATGAFLAERSEAEVASANLARERQEVEEHPEEEKEELSLYYQLKGLSREDADALAGKLSHNPDALLQLLATEELGGSQGGQNPIQAALAAGISTGLGALVPVLPFFFLQGTLAVIIAAAISLVAHFLVGAAKSLVTLRRWWAAGLEMTLAGIIVGGCTYAAGLLFHA